MPQLCDGKESANSGRTGVAFVAVGAGERTCAFRNPHHSSKHTHTPRCHQPSRPFGVEDRADLHAAEEDQKGEYTEDPADASRRMLCELVRAKMCLERANGI